MKKHVIAAGTAALAAFAASADPLVAAGPLVDVISVRYEGEVSAVNTLDGGDCLCGYEVGKRVSGTLLVDLRTLAPDLLPDDAGRADYFVEPPFLWPSFVVGRAPVRAVSRDRVQISDDVGGEDAFSIVDSESGVSVDAAGRERFDLDSVLLQASSRELDFLRGDSVFQTFALVGSHVGEGTIEIRHELLDGPAHAIGGTIALILSKLTVKPARCSL